MQIGLIAPPWVAVPPRGYGGTEAVVDVLARGLHAAGHDVLLYATGDSTTQVPTAWTYPSALGLDGGVASVAAEVAHVCDAYDRMLDADVDVIHDHTVTGPIRSLGRPGPPVVTTNHGPFDGPMSSIYRALADDVAIVAISHHQASTARSLPLAAVIHHGLDLDAVPVGSGDGGYALFLGRMCPNKGVHTAAGVAREAGIPLRIAAKIRDDDERGYFASKVEPLLGGGVEFVGEATPDEKWELLRHALCLLNPIAWPEPFGMVMIEALAAGTPVVATPCGAAPEIVDHGITGFLRAGEKALVAALLAVDRLDRTECRRVAEARFSGARLTAEHLLLYDRVLACRAVPA